MLRFANRITILIALSCCPVLAQTGDVIRIGHSQLAFVHDLSKAFADSSSLLRTVGEDETRIGAELSSDWYLRLAGEITRMFHGEIKPDPKLPAR